MRYTRKNYHQLVLFAKSKSIYSILALAQKCISIASFDLSGFINQSPLITLFEPKTLSFCIENACFGLKLLQSAIEELTNGTKLRKWKLKPVSKCSISIDKTSSQANRPLIQQQIMHIAWVITNWVWICIGKWLFSHFLGLARGESISCWFNFNYYSMPIALFVVSLLWPMCVYVFGLKLKTMTHSPDSFKWKKKIAIWIDFFECCPRLQQRCIALWLFFGVILSAFFNCCVTIQIDTNDYEPIKLRSIKQFYTLI